MRYKKLSRRIEIELNEIEQLINRINMGLKKAKQSSDDYYIDGVALNLHGLYSGIERIFTTIAENIDNKLPEGKDWHISLIDQMTKEVTDIRPAIISEELAEQLNEYRGFRHIVRNVYSYNFKPENIEKLVANINPIFNNLKLHINAFNEFLKSFDT
jgi:hypothetical protein